LSVLGAEETGMSVYRVTDLIGTSPTSWEDAAVEAVRRAQQTIDDIRVAEVLEQDMSIDDSGRITYRTKLRISFKVRPPKPRSDATS
jgi:flavin-binding protein dodecin